jgi:hypothetical protein
MSGRIVGHVYFVILSPKIICSDLNDNICDEWEDEKVEDMQHGRANWMRGGWRYANG